MRLNAPSAVSSLEAETLREIRMRLLTASLAAALMVVLPGAAETVGLFGRADGVKWPSLSPSGDQLAVHCSPEGKPSVCVFDIVNGGDNQYIPIGDDYRLEGMYWPSETHLIINVSEYDSLQLVDGQKEYEFERAISYNLEKQEATLLMREYGYLLDTQNVVSVLPDDPKHVLVMAYTRTSAGNRGGIGSIIPGEGGSAWALSTHKVNLNTGKSRRTRALGPSSQAAWFDVDGNTVAEIKTSPRTDGLELVAGGKTLLEFSSRGVQDFQVLGYDGASGKLVVFRDFGESDGLYFMSITDGAMQPARVGDLDVGRALPIEDSYTRQIVGFSSFDGLTRQIFTDPVLASAQEQLAQVLGDKRVNLLSWDSEKSKIAISAQSAGRPTEYYVFDRNAGALGQIGSMAPQFAEIETGQVIARQVSTRDGLNMEVLLTLPPGKSASDGPFPTVLMPHGGPEARDGLGFDWWSQALASEGYLVVQPNFRGSSGYGQEFRNAGFGEFGGKMIDDIADAGAWVVDQGLAASGSYCVAGSSYGGYAALMMGLKDKPRSRCLISVNGVTQPFAQVAAFDLDSETGEYWERYIGMNRFTSDEERAVISPVARADEYDQPVLLLYGEQDLVVPTAQARLLSSQLDGKPGFRAVSLGASDHYLATSSVRNTVLSESIAFLNANHPAR